MDYDLISQEDQDDMIVQTMKSQQMDHFVHTLNAARYRSIIASAADGPWKQRITGLLEETESRIGEVESIVDALLPQMPPEERKVAAVARIQAAEAIVKAG